MAAELPALLDRLETIWEALTPTQRPARLFRRLQGQRQVGTAARIEATRGFDLVEIGRSPEGDHPGGAQVEYQIEARIVYETKPLGTPKDLEKIIQQDEHQLLSTVRNESTWTAATIMVEPLAERSVEAVGSEAVILRLRFRAHLVEIQP